MIIFAVFLIPRTFLVRSLARNTLGEGRWASRRGHGRPRGLVLGKLNAIEYRRGYRRSDQRQPKTSNLRPALMFPESPPKMRAACTSTWQAEGRGAGPRPHPSGSLSLI
jgi:hypothetical protein